MGERRSGGDRLHRREPRDRHRSPAAEQGAVAQIPREVRAPGDHRAVGSQCEGLPIGYGDGDHRRVQPGDAGRGAAPGDVGSTHGAGFPGEHLAPRREREALVVARGARGDRDDRPLTARKWMRVRPNHPAAGVGGVALATPHRNGAIRADREAMASAGGDRDDVCVEAGHHGGSTRAQRDYGPVVHDRVSAEQRAHAAVEPFDGNRDAPLRRGPGAVLAPVVIAPHQHRAVGLEGEAVPAARRDRSHRVQPGDRPRQRSARPRPVPQLPGLVGPPSQHRPVTQQRQRV